MNKIKMYKKNLGFIKITKASSHDKEITITVNRIAKSLSPKAGLKFKELCKQSGMKMVIDLNGIPNVFYVSRKGTTLYSRAIHQNIAKPEVGKPRYIVVTTLRVEEL